MLLSVGDRVQVGRYTVHSRFNRVVNLVDGKRLISLVTQDVGAGPTNLVVSETLVRRVTTVEIVERLARLDGHEEFIYPNLRYDSSLPSHSIARELWYSRLASLRDIVVRDAPPLSLAFLLDAGRYANFGDGFERAFADHMREGVKKVQDAGYRLQPEMIAGVETIRGCGFGLTPSGDDFIVGMLLSLQLHGRLFKVLNGELVQEVCRTAMGSSILSNAFLTLAGEGRVDEKTKNLLMALLSGCRDGIRAAADALFLVGSTSGADMLTGFVLTSLQLLTLTPSLRETHS
ncbi:MAG: DUF2877 domain-containing protein [Verrucomicrobia bacterium]|nr:DUF2877 domain-containing protein [Verrucomicrobiota bacterium]